MKPPRFKVVTSAPEGKNHDPSVHSDLDEAGLSVYEFAVLAHSAYAARRKGANITTSHATVAEACRMSVSEVRRGARNLNELQAVSNPHGNGAGRDEHLRLEREHEVGRVG